jgi:hypothetical protein
MASVSHRGVFSAGDPGIGPEGPPGPAGAGGIDVRDYGVEVGAADNTAAIQDAFDDVSEGDTLVFPPGVVLCDEVTLTTANVRLVGYGSTLRKFSSGTSNSAILRVLGDNTTVEGFRLESGGFGSRYLLRANINTPVTPIRGLVLRDLVGVCDARTARGIFIGYYDRLTVERCYLENLLTEADPVTDESAVGLTLSAGTDQTSYDAQITRNRVVGWYRGIESFGTGLRQGTLLEGNTVRLAQDVGIYNYRSPQARVAKNHVEECFAGIYADSSAPVAGNAVEGNVVRSCTTYGIATEEHQGASIAGNTCTGNQDGLILGGGTGASTVSSNNCSYNTRYGIWADKEQTPVTDHLYDMLLVANICKLNGEDGIRIGGGKRTFTLEANICTDNGTSGPDIANPFAGIRVGLSTDGATSGIVTVRGGAIGNGINAIAGTGDTGKQGNGVLVEGGSSTTMIRVHGVYFAGHGVANIDSGGAPLEEWGNIFADGVNDFAGSTRSPFIVGGQLQIADGSTAAPALAFSADPDTGIRRSGANTFQFVSLAADRVQVATSGLDVGLSTAGSRLAISDGLRVAPESIKTVNYQITSTDTAVIFDGATLTGTLPPTPATNQALWVRNQNAGTSLTLDRNGQNINGAAANLTVAASTAVLLMHVTGSGWYVM